LYLAKDIITKHEGTITFKSEQNKGTTFIINIPTNLKISAIAKNTSKKNRLGHNLTPREIELLKKKYQK